MIINGDSWEEVKKLEDNSIEAIITDPPYDIGFMNKGWDKNSLITNVEFWKDCMRVLKPGGYLLSFGHSRTSHRMVTAVEEAGFEIRDTIMWMYGSGFPKSHNVAIAIDKKLKKMGHRGKRTSRYMAIDSIDKSDTKLLENGRTDDYQKDYSPISEEAKEWEGWGTALKPAYEPIVMARKPLAEKSVAENVMKWGTGGINIDECRVETKGEDFSQLKGRPITKLTNNRTDEASLSGPEQQEALRKLQELGRFPANVILDSEAGELLDEQSGFSKTTPNKNYKHDKTACEGNTFTNRGTYTPREDSGGASRFFHKVEVEPIVMARKPLEEKTVADNVLKHGTGAINIDDTRIDYNGEVPNLGGRAKHGRGEGYGFKPMGEELKANELGRFPANVILDSEAGKLLDEQSGPTKASFVRNKTDGARPFNNEGEATNYTSEKIDVEEDGRGASRYFHKVEAEPIMMARKPLDEQSGVKKQGKQLVTKHDNQDRGYREEYVNGEKTGNKGQVVNYHDGGGASRFFYCPKVSTRERNLNCDTLKDKEWANEGAAIPERANRPFKPSKNNHPTVKPVKLMEYLVKLVTKEGATVLDPFAGSGSTGVACKNLNRKFILIEREEEYCDIIRARCQQEHESP